MSVPPRRSVVEQFWAHVSEGRLAREAAVAVGVSETTGVRWFGDAGGGACLIDCVSGWA